MFTELRAWLQRVIYAEGLFAHSTRSPVSQISTDLPIVPRIDNRAARFLFREQIDFDYRTSLRSSAEFTLAGYGGEFPGGRMYVAAVWGSLSDDQLNMIAELNHCALLPHLARIEISDGSGITDEGLASLAAIDALRRLQITDAPHITDGGLRRLLKSLNWLESLELRLKQCTDAAFDIEVRFPEVTQIDVGFTQLTDAGLLCLISKAPKLKSIDITGTLVTGRAVFQARISGLEIVV